MEKIRSYSDIFNLGHKAAVELFQGDVVVEEKVDGSQISFARFGDTLLMRSKGQQLVVDAPEKMFAAAVLAVQGIYKHLPEGWTFRGEYLSSPKHNTLCYDRTPKLHIIIYDIDKGDQDYLGHEEKKKVAEALGFEVVPTLFFGRIESVEQIKSLLPAKGILGGAQPEGVVIKNYARYNVDKKVLMGKYVREEFKEIHAGEWRKSNPAGGDIIDTLIGEYRTPARWEKALQHLRDAGKIVQEPRDIGALMEEVEADIEKECADEIKRKLWNWAWPKVARGTKAGLPDWYKNKLLEFVVAEMEKQRHEEAVK